MRAPCSVIAVMLSFLLMTPESSLGVVLLRENFDYPDGNLGAAGQNTGFSLDANNMWTGGWTPDDPLMQILNSQVNSNPPSTGPLTYTRPFTLNQPAGTTLYFGFDMEQLSGNEGGWRFEIQFLGGDVIVGMANEEYRAVLDGTVDATAGGAADQDFTLHTFIGRIEFNAVGSDERLTVWQDATLETDVPLLTVLNDLGALDLGSNVGLFVSGDEAIEIAFDNFRLGTDFDFSPPPVIPEPSSLLLVGLGCCGAWQHTRRRRRTA